MERYLAGLSLKICLVYLDGVIVFGNTFEATLKRLEIVLRRLGDFGLRLKASKCKLFHTELSYLGHIVSQLGISPDPDKIKALQEWLQHPPKNASELQFFLGFAGYYRTFVGEFTQTAKPLHQLVAQQSKKQLPKKSQFQWTPTCQAAFETIISKLTSRTVLVYPDFSSPCTLHTDASGEGLGAALYQVQDGQTRVIAYGTRTLNDAEHKYSTYHRIWLQISCGDR